MKNFHFHFHFTHVFISISILSISLATAAAAFSPADRHLLNCGSAAPAAAPDGRVFSADARHLRSASDPDPDPHVSPIYHSARIFAAPGKYSFPVEERGTHLVRLHFYPFAGLNCSTRVRFHVVINENVLMYDVGFSGFVVKDFMIWVDGDEVVVRVVPAERGKIGFVSAIEVISAPRDLVADVAEFVGVKGSERVVGLRKNAYETVYRVNVGGVLVTPFNDSLWRTWVPDGEFLERRGAGKRVFFSGRVHYRLGGASREVGPDNVYNSARVIDGLGNEGNRSNLTWAFPVARGFKYLVRMHFCDIASVSLGLLYFNVYVNGNLAYDNLDLSYVTNWMLASPFYADFVVDAESLGVLTVAVGPSNMSVPHAIDGILNGLEVFKMNNSMGSLDGETSVESVFVNWQRRRIGCLVPMIAAMCFLLTVTLVVRRRKTGFRDSFGWSRLPVDVSEVDLKSKNQMP